MPSDCRLIPCQGCLERAFELRFIDNPFAEGFYRHSSGSLVAEAEGGTMRSTAESQSQRVLLPTLWHLPAGRSSLAFQLRGAADHVFTGDDVQRDSLPCSLRFTSPLAMAGAIRPARPGQRR